MTLGSDQQVFSSGAAGSSAHACMMRKLRVRARHRHLIN